MGLRRSRSRHSPEPGVDRPLFVWGLCLLVLLCLGEHEGRGQSAPRKFWSKKENARTVPLVSDRYPAVLVPPVARLLCCLARAAAGSSGRWWFRAHLRDPRRQHAAAALRVHRAGMERVRSASGLHRRCEGSSSAATSGDWRRAEKEPALGGRDSGWKIVNGNLSDIARLVKPDLSPVDSFRIRHVQNGTRWTP